MREALEKAMMTMFLYGSVFIRQNADGTIDVLAPDELRSEFGLAPDPRLDARRAWIERTDSEAAHG